jgi:dTDP-4-dehydrorhamnose 3,5-epimerase
MNFTTTPIDGLVILEPQVFEDERGYFFEAFNQSRMDASGHTTVFVQDNQSRSGYGVIRGLHYQMEPFAQTKLVRVLEGTILDVVVDIRKGSPTYGSQFSIELTAQNKKQLYIPKGFAHGFSVLSTVAVVLYKCDSFYNKSSEGGILYNDPDLGIDWKIDTEKALVSEKDLQLPPLKNIITNFTYQPA